MVVTVKSQYKNVVVNKILLYKYGKKMHKSRGNAINPFELIEEYGADTIRWYLPYVSPVWTPIKFDEEGLKEVYSKFFNTLRNTYNFFALYANTDEVDARNLTVNYDSIEEIDKWLLSKYHKLIKYTKMAYEEYDLNKVVRSVTDFVSEDLSNWYIRRNRRRFWAHDLDDSKKAVYKTTYDVLVGLTKIIAPVVPFISEEIYTALTGGESVHLTHYPRYDNDRVNEEIERKMDLVRDLISLGRNVREEVKIKVRQPIKEVILDGKNKEVIGDLVDLIKEELNVKEVNFADDLSIYMNYEVKPNFKVCGPILGKNIKDFAEHVKEFTAYDIKSLENGNTIKFTVNGKEVEVTYDMLDVRVSSKEGFDSTHNGENFIVLNTKLNQDLVNEGIARELISKIQQLRKSRDYNVIDRINIYYSRNEEFEAAIDEFRDMIMQDTLCEQMLEKNDLTEEYNLNGITVKLDVEQR